MRTVLRGLLVVAALGALVSVAGCSLLGSGEPAEVRITVIGADQVGNSVNLVDGRSYTVLAEAYDSSGDRLNEYRDFTDYTWSSTDNSVAYVDPTDEEIDARDPGTCTVIATLKDDPALSGALNVDVN